MTQKPRITGLTMPHCIAVKKPFFRQLSQPTEGFLASVAWQKPGYHKARREFPGKMLGTTKNKKTCTRDIKKQQK
ncbi:MAG: hypothetical protein AAGC93_05600 [Cyanobacteria bacterium P01_F01_bin.53]